MAASLIPLFIILLFFLDVSDHMPVVDVVEPDEQQESAKQPGWRVLIRAVPSLADQAEGDVILTGWHSCFSSGAQGRRRSQEDNCNLRFGASQLKVGSEQNHGQVAAVSVGDECVCRCPSKAPTFVVESAGGRCIEKLADCQKPVLFKTGGSPPTQSFVPPASFPTESSLEAQPVLSSTWSPMWKESSIKVRINVGLRCEMERVVYMGDRSLGWQEGDLRWFRIGWVNNDAAIFWNISRSEEIGGIRHTLNAALVRLDLKCQRGSSSHLHCLTFRLPGEIVATSIIPTNVVDSDTLHPLPLDAKPKRPISASNQQQQSPQGRLETILIILLAILLFLSIFGSIVLWNVCWRLKKSELISTLQMQFLYHIKQEKEKATTAEAQHRYQMAAKAAAAARSTGQHSAFGNPVNSQNVRYATGNNGADGVYGEDLDDATCQSAGEHYGPFGSNGKSPSDYGDGFGGGENSGPVPTKRKLYFSAEFFEPHFMANPPPMAEQFLYDLRKMIAITKQRLMLRSRHVPRLAVIKEDAGEEVSQAANNYGFNDEREFDFELDEAVSGLRPKTPTPSLQPEECEGSPKSDRSDLDQDAGDSGISVSNDATGSESNSDSSTSSQSPPTTPPTALAGVNGGNKRVRQLVRGFESPSQIPPASQSFLSIPSPTNRRLMQQQQQQPPSSYFQSQLSTGGDSPPILQNGSRIPVSKSPKLTPKSLSVAQPAMRNNQIQKPSSGPLLPPRNTPPPPPTQPPPPIPQQIGEHANAMLMVAAAHQQHQQQQKNRLAAQKRATGTYAVFPTDNSMLKKSLPRRSKKAGANKAPNSLALPQQPNRTGGRKGATAFIETIM